MARNSQLAGGVMKYSRSKMYAKRAQHKRTKTVTKVEAKKSPAVVSKQVKGDKNGGSRKVKFFFLNGQKISHIFRSMKYVLK